MKGEPDEDEKIEPMASPYPRLFPATGKKWLETVDVACYVVSWFAILPLFFFMGALVLPFLFIFVPVLNRSNSGLWRVQGWYLAIGTVLLVISASSLLLISNRHTRSSLSSYF
ncbi:MAG: hypothetical protein JNK63_04590 [Chthonomonas sp.]|nr:hypothetical protein [Chthonomonas sp.]